jgi:hypothetical protein
VKAWWRDVVQKRGHSRKAMASLAMLVNWEIWKERNAHIFTNKSSTSNMLILKIKEEVNLWSIAGAKTSHNASIIASIMHATLTKI